MLANLQLDIDCDREAERIFSLLSSNESKLQNMEGQHVLMSCQVKVKQRDLCVFYMFTQSNTLDPLQLRRCLILLDT